jgi:queuine tRNA-ribosyltransferase
LYHPFFHHTFMISRIAPPETLPSPGTFTIHATDGYARTGSLHTPHGAVHTPVFMPVGTLATVKGVSREQLDDIGSQITLANTYHLYLSPGHERIGGTFGGLHEFMNYHKPLLTDSGGYQVFSLGASGRLLTGTGLKPATISDEGVVFYSHRDGSCHFFSPAKAMQIQASLGADIVMAFDECAPKDSDHAYATIAMNRTHDWARQSHAAHGEAQVVRKEQGKHEQLFFPIIQGCMYGDLRIESAKYIASLDTPGIAIGGLSVGESMSVRNDMLDILAAHLPVGKPHYLMGLGTPEDLVEGIYRGIDMFDCVLPARLGRHGVVFSSQGRLVVKSARYASQTSGIPVDDDLSTHVSRTYSLGYLRHLLHVGETLGGQLLTLHNLEYLHNITRGARQHIEKGTFEIFRERILAISRANSTT